MAPMSSPQPEHIGVLENVTQYWAQIAWFISLAGAAFALLIRRIRWSDRITAEMRQNRGYTDGALRTLTGKIDGIERRHAEWEVKVDDKIESFCSDVSNLHERQGQMLSAIAEVRGRLDGMTTK